MLQALPRPSVQPLAGHLFVGHGHHASVVIPQSANTLATFRFFDTPTPVFANATTLDLPLPDLGGNGAFEYWQVDDDVERGTDGALHYARGGGWLFAALDVDEGAHGDDIEAAARAGYRHLCDFLRREAVIGQVQRIWNYFDRITEGHGDDERYKRFCVGRRDGTGDFFDSGFPAATVIGSPLSVGRLIIYCLASTHPGTRIENPRQTSPWRYPRQYGRVSPGFTRAMLLPGRKALAISGTAAIIGHESRHDGDLVAQLDEICTNINTLLGAAQMAPGLDQRARLKVYLRDPANATIVRDYFDRLMPEADYLLLHGHVCRPELLVEIDGWRFP